MESGTKVYPVNPVIPSFVFVFLVGNYSGIPVGRGRGWEQLLDFRGGAGQNSTLTVV
jgi:hypothetical protein